MAQNKYQRMVEAILDSGKEIDHEPTAKFLKDMHKRFQENPGTSVSMKQGAWIEKSYKINIEGMSPSDVRKECKIPDSYDNCSCFEDQDGWFISIEERTVDVPIANSEARIVLAWLHKAIPILKDFWDASKIVLLGEEELPYFGEEEDNFLPDEPTTQPKTQNRPF